MNQIKVAIINHNKNYTDTLSSIISNDHDFTISGIAKNEYDAYHLICAKQPDIVLSDITIGEFNTFYFIKKIKNSTSISKLPQFVIITPFGNENIVSQAFKHDIAYFILAPFKTEYALNRIKQIYTNNLPQTSNTQQKELPQEVAINSIEHSVSNFLYKLGISSNAKGYKYIKSALKMCTIDISLLDGITKLLYPEIAKEFNTSPKCVEHSIRNLVKHSCENDHTELFATLFGKDLNKNLTNTEFILAISSQLRANHAIT